MEGRNGAWPRPRPVNRRWTGCSFEGAARRLRTLRRHFVGVTLLHVESGLYALIERTNAAVLAPRFF